MWLVLEFTQQTVLLSSLDCVQVSKASSAQASTVQATSATAAAPLPATVPLAVGQVAAAAAGEVVALRAECAHMDEQLALVSAQLDAVHSERDAEQCGPVLRSQHKRGLCSSLSCRYLASSPVQSSASNAATAATIQYESGADTDC